MGKINFVFSPGGRINDESKKLRRNTIGNTVHTLIFVSAISVFLPYYISSVIICLTGVTFCILPGTRDKIFIHKGSFTITVFTVITFIVALVNQNYIGLIRTVVFAMMLVVTFVARSLATKRFYETLLDCFCAGGSFATAYSILEKILHRSDHEYRCQSFFTNPNFFGTAIVLVILICAYKAVVRAKNAPLFYVIAVFNAVGIYLCGSMGLWFILFIGILLLLLLNHEYRLLAIFLGVAVTVCIAVILIPQLVPRLNELSDTTSNRVKIWKFAIGQIKEAPIFGRGFFTYKHLYNQLSPSNPEIYKAALAHNILIDCMLSHGIVGTVLVGIYLVQFFKTLLKCHDGLKKRGHPYVISTFIASIAAAIACYGIIDTTVIWVQTGMIIMLITSGIGVDERRLRHITHAEHLKKMRAEE